MRPSYDPSDTSADEFLALAHHAILTRLTNVTGYAQLLQRTLNRSELEQERALDSFARLDSQLSRFSQQIQQYMDACRLQWGQWQHSFEPVDLSQIVQTTAELSRQERAGRVGHLVQVDGDLNVVGLWERRWLQRAIAAILGNAATYTAAQGKIRITIRQHAEQVSITIADTGIGIAEDERERIFMPFVRGRRAAEFGDGMGLGLFIANRAVANHGGTITVDSTLDKGSIFAVELPLRPPAHVAA